MVAKRACTLYSKDMSFLLRKIARQLVQKAASDPRARDKMVKVASDVAKQAQQIAKEDNKAFATGRALRRAFDKMKQP